MPPRVARWSRSIVLLLTLSGLVPLAARASRAQAVGPVRFAAAALNGDSVHVGLGRVTLVNVFATWCTTCKTEFGELDALTHDLKPSGIAVIALAVDDAPRAVVRRFVDARKASFPVVFDSAGVLARGLAIVGVPETFLIAADGRVVWHQRGPIDRDMPALRAAIQACAEPNATRPRCAKGGS